MVFNSKLTTGIDNLNKDVDRIIDNIKQQTIQKYEFKTNMINDIRNRHSSFEKELNKANFLFYKKQDWITKLANIDEKIKTLEFIETHKQYNRVDPEQKSFLLVEPNTEYFMISNETKKQYATTNYDDITDDYIINNGSKLHHVPIGKFNNFIYMGSIVEFSNDNNEEYDTKIRDYMNVFTKGVPKNRNFVNIPTTPPVWAGKLNDTPEISDYAKGELVSTASDKIDLEKYCIIRYETDATNNTQRFQNDVKTIYRHRTPREIDEILIIKTKMEQLGDYIPFIVDTRIINDRIEYYNIKKQRGLNKYDLETNYKQIYNLLKDLKLFNSYEELKNKFDLNEQTLELIWDNYIIPAQQNLYVTKKHYDAYKSKYYDEQNKDRIHTDKNGYVFEFVIPTDNQVQYDALKKELNDKLNETCTAETTGGKRHPRKSSKKKPRRRTTRRHRKNK